MIRKCCLTFILVFVSISLAQNYFSGEIQRNTRWSGEVYINGDVTVPQGVILTIDAGTRIYFKPKTDVLKTGKDRERAELNINGMVLAKSNSMSTPILFTSESKTPQMNDWYGITIKNFYDQSILQNCIVEYAYKGITCYGSSPIISGGEVRYNHHAGISCEVKAAPVITNVLLMGNGFAGINCELASNPIISGCTISENIYGVIIFSKSVPDLGTLPLDGKKSKGENRITNNFEFDVYNHSNNSVNAQNNTWSVNNPREVPRVIYDKADNPAYGDVIYSPLFTPPIVVQPPPIIAAAAPPPADVPTESQVAQPSEIPDSSSTEVSQELFSNAAEQTVQDTFPRLLTTLTASAPAIEDLSPNESSPVYSPPPVEEPVIQEPVLENFLDTGKRQYLRRAQPEYPRIYLQTGTEGDVLIQVVVNEQGNIEDYRVLKSDGELFTEASLSALKKFQYKPGTLNGKTVKYKVIERFRFKLNKSQ